MILYRREREGEGKFLVVKGSIKRLFLGNNTPQGFFSYYDYILPKDSTRIFVIKGGPGVGKSTFMSAIAEDMVQRGFDVEIHHCPSDSNSIDAIVFPEIGIGMIDGTWPHVVDPKIPGAVDEIVWLGRFWNEDSVRSHKSEIVDCQKGSESVFSRAFRYLKAAQIVYEDWESVNIEAMDFGLCNVATAKLIEEVFSDHPVSSKTGEERRLFASAITPDGMVNHLHTIVAGCERRFVIQGDPGTGKSHLLGKVKEAALERGFHVEAYYCPLHPHKVEHLVVPKIKLAFTKSIEPHSYVPGPDDRIMDMNRFRDEEIVKAHEPYAALAQKEFGHLFDSAIYYIGQAKKYHDALERYYAPNMDFKGINELREEMLHRILGYAQEHVK